MKYVFDKDTHRRHSTKGGIGVGYLTEEQLVEFGFESLGKGVKISDKASIYNPEFMKFGDYARIDDFCVISGKVEIGRNVHVACLCNIAGGTEGIMIDDFAGIAYGSHILAQTDDYTGMFMTNPTIPAKYTNVTRKSIYIGKHSLVGTSSVIFPGVCLAEGTSVGAMSLVTKSTREWSMYIGIPARRIRARSKNLLNLEIEYLAFEGKL